MRRIDLELNSKELSSFIGSLDYKGDGTVDCDALVERITGTKMLPPPPPPLSPPQEIGGGDSRQAGNKHEILCTFWCGAWMLYSLFAYTLSMHILSLLVVA
jgi:hypothetical protein